MTARLAGKTALIFEMRGPDMAPHTPRLSGRPGEAVAPLANPGEAT